MKMKVDWKPCRVLDLISYLHDLVKLQYADLKRALYGQGNYQVVAPFNNHCVAFSTWMQASEARRDELFQNFVCDNGA